MKIQIAVTTDVYFDQRVKRIASSLAKNGYEVSVVGRKKGVVKDPENLTFHAHWLSCFFKRSALFYAEYNIRLFFYLLFHKSQIICACDLDTMPACSLAAFLKRRILVFDAHEYFEESVEILHKKYVRKIWEGIGYICIPRTKARYTVSASLADVLTKKYKRPFQLVRNIPESFPQLQFANRSKRLLWYQGAVNKGRGLELLIDCLHDLPEYSLGIAGEGDLLDQLKQRVHEAKLKDRVRFYGRLSRIQMCQKASEAWIGLDLLSDTSPSYYYSLSNKTFDYMHVGLPVIQMDFPEYRKLHEQFPMGILLQKLGTVSLVEAIRKMEDQTFYDQCRDACLKASLHFTWSEEEKTLISVYQDLLS